MLSVEEMAPKMSWISKHLRRRPKAYEASNSKHDNDQQGSPATSSALLPTQLTGMEALVKRQTATYSQAVAKVEHSPHEQITSSTAQPASWPQQATLIASPSPPPSHQPVPPEVHTSLTFSGQLETTAAPSLWDRAYEDLERKDPELVKKYEELLSRELKTSMYQTARSCCFR
jgi:hypothetical protein